MGEFSPIHWLIVLAIILLLFGGRKIPELARGLGEGIRSFKEVCLGITQRHPQRRIRLRRKSRPRKRNRKLLQLNLDCEGRPW